MNWINCNNKGNGFSCLPHPLPRQKCTITALANWTIMTEDWPPAILYGLNHCPDGSDCFKYLFWVMPWNTQKKQHFQNCYTLDGMMDCLLHMMLFPLLQQQDLVWICPDLPMIHQVCSVDGEYDIKSGTILFLHETNVWIPRILFGVINNIKHQFIAAHLSVPSECTFLR